MRTVRVAVFALGYCCLAGAPAQETEREEPGPDLDFLEYLGAWAEEDDEWLAIEEWQKGNAAPDEDPEGSERLEGDEDETD